SYRYRRMLELLGTGPGGAAVSVEQHWAWQRDTRNLMGESLAPVRAEALLAHDRTRDLGQVLADWNHDDALDSAGALLFQELVRQLVHATVRDELGEAVAAAYLDNLYYWQERFEHMVRGGASPFFDDVTTPEVEDLPTLVRRTADAARARLEPLAGVDPASWRWGDLHHLTFVHPLVRGGALGRWLGSGPHLMAGSAETLYRGWYNFDEAFEASHVASLRMVADLADEEKVLAVLPGGVVGRSFHPHQKDQIEAFMEGEVRYWWFSQEAVDANAAHRLRLLP
ncbi:MAG: penicillin acylase family protein, partial [Holophagales bacterium]|nr:penicillin acylase family protein [Holophagales bacterium]